MNNRPAYAVRPRRRPPFLTSKAGNRYRTLLSGLAALFLTAIHIRPSALEPPGDIINQHPSALVGGKAFAWLLGLLVILVEMFAYHIHHWRQARQQAN